jgi:hypothetical protein
MTMFGSHFNKQPDRKMTPPSSKAEPATVENLKRLSDEADAWRDPHKGPAAPVVMPKRDET